MLAQLIEVDVIECAAAAIKFGLAREEVDIPEYWPEDSVESDLAED